MRDAVHGQVVIGDIASVLGDEILPEAQLYAQVPHHPYDGSAILHGEALHEEARPTATYHVQIDAVAGAELDGRCRAVHQTCAQ